MLVEAHRYDAFAWRRDSWDAARPYWIDKLTGSPRLRTMIDAGADVADVVGAWADELAEFNRRREPQLLYRRFRRPRRRPGQEDWPGSTSRSSAWQTISIPALRTM
ncbi:Protein of unknown function [Micromonospora citrea]|uniref:Peptidoglycan beta-N-acetylmuramidase NamZ C-terminal domain-containing protein n=1 Tax=Micromonospora citrea TaxID=47855 RepID=A0A1C6VSC6_9ACTN|nr:Protein of unknown function [Micromonospora citrea]